MFKNYLKVTLNNLLKDKLYSLINIAGLSIGLAACIFIALYVLDETSYDKHWQNADRIYRLNSTYDMTGGSPRRYSQTSYLALPALENTYADRIELASRVISGFQAELRNGDRRVEEEVYFVEQEFPVMFPFDTLGGDLVQALSDPSGIALSESLAVSMFGTSDVLGQVITIPIFGSTRDYQVQAVYQLPENNSILEPPAMVRINETDLDAVGLLGWTAVTTMNFLQLSDEFDHEIISAGLADFTDRYVDISSMRAGPGVMPSDRVGFDLQNIQDIHLNSSFDTLRAGGNQTVVIAFSAIAVLVLLIGCINFTLLSTARATQRAREVGMRKAIGAARGELILQFIGESMLIVFPAILAALAIVELCLPVFEALVSKDINIVWSDPKTLLALLTLMLIVGFTGGLYPAFVLSGFKPSATLMSNRSSETRGSSRLRNLLVIFQFGISIALIIATAVIYTQVKFAANRDPGFNKDNILIVDSLLFRRDVGPQKIALKDQVAGLAGVVDVSLSAHQPTQQDGMANNNPTYRVRGEGALAEDVVIASVSIDENFFRTYEIPLVAGRVFDPIRDQAFDLMTRAPDASIQYTAIVNESAARVMGFANADEAIGMDFDNTMTQDPTAFTIIGVVPDTHFFSLRATPRPEVFVYGPANADVLSIRFQGAPLDILADVREIWTQLMGDVELSTGFVEANTAQEFAQEELEAKVLLGFSLLAIIIACLGLYGSAAFAVDRRTKEIGIRKIMGAEIREIVTLLLWDFSRPVLIANIIAWPIALWAMLTWLQQFPYRIDTLLLVPFCVLAGAVALSIAWLTVAGNTLKVATRNPVLALRYE